ncbi:RNI-like protein [Atractiella rhizophila]|nr:RNI-like protein [Atractiella rhizophila]
MSLPNPQIPSRISLLVPPATIAHHGTLLFIGEVEGTKGTWWGVEWDDVDRGKHSGEKDGKKYFETRLPHSATFIRPPITFDPPASVLSSPPTKPSISLGQSFLSAIRLKYLTSIPLADSYALNPEVGRELELVGMEKIAKKFGDMKKLRTIGLEEEGVYGWDEKEEGTLDSLQKVDLSRTLLARWEDVMDIVRRLPKLDELALNSNRFAVLDTPLRVEIFRNLRVLQLNKTAISAQEIFYLHSSLPLLEDLQAGYNGITSLLPLCEEGIFPSMRSLNIEGNAITSWEEVVVSLGRLPLLERLILSFNPISSINFGPPTDSASPLPFSNLKTLALNDCPLTMWSSIDALASISSLRNLSLGHSALPEASDRDFRAFVIARLPSLNSLDHSTISPRERRDSEIFYLGRIEQELAHGSTQVEERHPLFKSLVETYGLSDKSDAPKKDGIKSKLLDLTLITPRGERIPLSLVPTTPVRLLRMRVAKLLKSPIPKNKGWKLVAMLRAQGGEEVIKSVMEDEAREITWYGVEGGEELLIVKE